MNTNIPVTERAWAAGFFDGEGSVSIHRTRHGRKNDEAISVMPRICVAQLVKGDELLERFRKALGDLGSITLRKQTGSFSKNPGKIWEYYLVGWARVQTAISIMWPYLGPVKKEQIAKVLKECTEVYRNKPEKHRKKGITAVLTRIRNKQALAMA